MNRVCRLALCWLLFVPGFAATRSAWAGQPSTNSEAEAQIAYYRKRIGGPGTYPAYARLGLAYVQLARESGTASYYREAVRFLRQSLDYQRNFEALWGMAVALSQQHYFREALDYAQEAAAAMPSNPEAQGVLFDIRLALGDVGEAKAVGIALLEGQPGFHAFTRLAALREYQGNHPGAVEAMLKARDAAAADALPATARAWAEVRLGSLFVADCNASAALEAYHRALAIAPGYFLAIEHLAEWHAGHGHWEKAGSLYRELLKTRPEPQYRFALAEVLRHEGKAKAANREAAKALRELRRAAQSGAQDVFRPLALCLLESGNSVAEGLRWARRDWEVRHDALAADTLAWACFRTGRYDEALSLSGAALDSGTKHPAVLLHAGSIRFHLAKVAEGRALIKQTLACPWAMGPLERTLAKQVQAELSRNIED